MRLVVGERRQLILLVVALLPLSKKDRGVWALLLGTTAATGVEVRPSQHTPRFHQCGVAAAAAADDDDDDDDSTNLQYAETESHSISSDVNNEGSSIGNFPETSPSSSSDYELRFGGVGRLYATADAPSAVVLERLQKAAVVVIGVGGVGSWAVEALARSGVGTLVLVDLDDVCISNTNRQLPALSSTVGQMKLDVLQQRLQDINPEAQVHLVHDFVTADNVQEIIDVIEEKLEGQTISAVIDAIDGAKEKASILATCRDRAIHVVTCGGAAGRVDTRAVQIKDLTVIQNDKLLATTKKYLRKHYGFPRGLPFRELQKGRKVQKWYLDGVYSEELVQSETEDNNSSLRQCDGALGTACFVTGTFGFVAASTVIERIALDRLRAPRKKRQ